MNRNRRRRLYRQDRRFLFAREWRIIIKQERFSPWYIFHMYAIHSGAKAWRIAGILTRGKFPPYRVRVYFRHWYKFRQPIIGYSFGDTK